MANSMRQQWKVRVLCTVLLTMAAGNACAAVSWNIAKRPDEKIISQNKKLEKKLKDYPHLTSEPFFILLSDQTYVVEHGHYNHVINRLYLINDASAVEDGSRRFIVNKKADIEETEAWRQRDGKIERLDKSAWEIVEGDDIKEVYFAPTSLEDGDILGFSMDVRYPWGWGGSYLWLADDIPTMMNRTRVKTHKDLAYRISWYHFRKDLWSQKIISRSHGVANDVRVTHVDIPAIPDGPWTPTEWEFLPYLYVSRRGYWMEEIRSWIYNVSWNEVASQEMKGCQWNAKKCGQIATLVNTMVAGEDSDAGKLDVLHRFVRDEVVSVSYREVAGDDRDIITAIKDRQATHYEKGMMLFTMCKAAGIEVELLVGRSRFSGAIDNADPTGMQLVDYVVKLDGPEPRYYAPQFSNTSAGMLPPQMQGEIVLVIPKSLPTSPEKIIQDLISKSGGSLAKVWNEYRQHINQVEWAQWVKLPGDPQEVAGSSMETMFVDPGSGKCTVTLQVLGNSRLQQGLRAEASSQQKLEDYLGTRFADAEISEASVEFGVARYDTLTASAAISGLVLPPSGDEEWILPAAAVYGKPALSEWDGHDGDPFIVRATERHIVVWRVPLPDDWDGIQKVEEFVELHPRVSYMRNVFQEDGDLVVMRTLQLNQGLTMYSDLPGFRDSLARIQAQERNPLLVMRK